MTDRLAAVLILALLSFACAHVVPLAPSAPKPEDLVPIPLTVGVYYSPEFRETVHVRVRMLNKWVTTIGEGSVDLFDQVFPMMFRQVVYIGSHPPLEGSGTELAAIVVPRLEAFDVSWPAVASIRYVYKARVSYRFSLYEADGTPIASWVVTGFGKREAGMSDLTSGPIIREAFEGAIENAARKFLADFRELPEVRRWLYRSGVRDAN